MKTEPRVEDWVGRTLDAGEGEIVVEEGYIRPWLEATENANPLYWDPRVAEEITGGPIAPPSMLSVWMRPLNWRPDREKPRMPLQLHPEYIHSRLQPQITIDFPERDEEYAILKENLPFGEEHILNYVTDFLQQAHAADERYTVRDGINIARFAIKLKFMENGSVAKKPSEQRFVLRTAVLETLGDEALRYVPRP